MKRNHCYCLLMAILLLSHLPVWAGTDYSGYNGKWQDETLINNQLTDYIQKTLELQITAAGCVAGQIEYQQVKPTKTGLKATAQLTGRLENGRALCRFMDDWGHAGFVEIEFFRHQLRAEITITKIPQEPAAWGVYAENIYFTRLNHQPLLRENEAVIFSFRLPDSGQILSVGLARREPDYLVCRIGKPGHAELEFPTEFPDCWRKFAFSNLITRDSGVESMELSYLFFKHQGRTFTIYQEYQARIGEEAVGVRIEDPNTGKITELKGDPATVIGSLTLLRHEKRLRRLE